MALRVYGTMERLSTSLLPRCSYVMVIPAENCPGLAPGRFLVVKYIADWTVAKR